MYFFNKKTPDFCLFKQLNMQLKWSGPPMIIDRAPSKDRPFANILNPYDHACSVLCNHPINSGGRLSWFARKVTTRNCCAILSNFWSKKFS